MLDVLGLDADEEAAYRRLVELPSGSAADLADLAGTDLATAASLLSALEARGLVARSTTGNDRYVASPPSVALGALMVQRQEDLRRAQLELAALTEIYRGAASERTMSDVIDVVIGPDAVAQRFAQLQRTATREIQVLVKAEVAVVSAEQNVDEEIAIGRGVQYDVVVERPAFDRPGFYDAAEQSLRRGERIRVAQSVPLRLLIADRQFGLVPLYSSSDKRPGGGALLIHPSGLLDALQTTFDLVWQASTKLVLRSDGVSEEAGDRLDEVGTRVLSLLLAGLTDQAIGNQLGLSLRTVQRQVRQLMNRARVDTRLQLGYEAGRRGWL